MSRILIATSIVVGLLRFTIPSRPVFTWPGSYEALAHIWVGVLFCLAFQKNKVAIWSLVVITILEVGAALGGWEGGMAVVVGVLLLSALWVIVQFTIYVKSF